jgi:hypothetical protein
MPLQSPKHIHWPHTAAASTQCLCALRNPRLPCMNCYRCKVTCYSFPTTIGHSNSKNHHVDYPLGIKWFQRNELCTSHLLPPPSTILLTSTIGTTSMIDPPPPILTAGASTSTATTAIQCRLSPRSPPFLPESFSPRVHPRAGRSTEPRTCTAPVMADPR